MENDERILQILENSACLKESQLLGYLSSRLFPEELRVVELHLASCKLCRDALEGFKKTADREKLLENLALPELAYKNLEKQTRSHVDNSLNGNSEAKKRPVIASFSKGTFGQGNAKESPRQNNFAWLGIIGIVWLLLLGGFLFWQYETSNPELPSFTFSNENKNGKPGNNKQTIVNDSTLQEDTSKNEVVTAIAPAKAASVSSTLKTVGNDSATSAKNPVKATSVDSGAKENLTALSKTETNPAQNSIIGDTQIKTLTQESAKPTKPKVQKAVTPSQPQKQAATEDNKETASQKPDKTPSQPPAATSHSDYATGYQLYQKKQYASALLYLNTAAENDINPNHWQALYYSGICNYKIGKRGRAKRLLRKVIKAKVALSDAAAEKLKEIEAR